MESLGDIAEKIIQETAKMREEKKAREIMERADRLQADIDKLTNEGTK
jgi:hypothetical protein